MPALSQCRSCWVQVLPWSVVTYTPVPFVCGSNGQLDDPPVGGVQSGSSISSLAPLIAFEGFTGLTAIGDSFCLFCGKWAAGGLTRDSVTVTARAAVLASSAASAAPAATSRA